MIKLRITNMLRVLALVAGILVLCVSCQRKTPMPKGLILLPGAREVRQLGNRSRAVKYDLPRVYTAEKTITDLSKRIVGQGWKPLKKDYFKPDDAALRLWVWTEFLDTSQGSKQIVRAWYGEWRDTDGDLLKYLILYVPPQGAEAEGRVQVMGVHMPKEEVQARQRRVLAQRKKTPVR